MDYMFQMKCAWHPTFPGAERPVPFFASFGGASFAVIAFTAVINNMASGPNQIGTIMLSLAAAILLQHRSLR